MIYFLISLFLDMLLSNILPNTYQNLTYFFPLILLTALPISYLLIRNNKIFFPLVILTGLLYDVLYSDIFLINTYYFILVMLFLYVFNKNKTPSIFNIIFITLSIIIFYDIYLFFTLILLKYAVFEIEYLLYKIIRTIPLNLLYLIFSLLVLKSRIFSAKNKFLKF